MEKEVLIKRPGNTRLESTFSGVSWRSRRTPRQVPPIVFPSDTSQSPDHDRLCPRLKSESLELNCMSGGSDVPCNQPMASGAVAIERCRYFYTSSCEKEAFLLTCLDNGRWDHPLFYCTPGGVCKQEGNSFWTWKILSECSKAQEGLRYGVLKGECYTGDGDPYICCEPDTSPGDVDDRWQQLVDRKSVQMCKKYAKSVFLQVGEADEKVDTCALSEPIDAPLPDPPLSGHIPQLPTNIEPREFPHMAVLGYGEKSHKRPTVRCAGSLISERYVLSVASCAETQLGPASWVRLGDYNINSNLDDVKTDSQSLIIDILEIIKHPEFETARDTNEIYYHDIALFKLSDDVVFNEYIRPICLHAENQFSKSFATTTGWGPVELGERPSDVVQKVNTTMVGDQECSDAYKFYGEVKDGLDTDLVICAALLDGRQTCISIPGSPLQLRLLSPYCMYSLVGLAYFGRACFVVSPGVYVRVSHYLDWIEDEVWPRI